MHDSLRQARNERTRVLEAAAEFDRTMTRLRAFTAQFEEMVASMRILRASMGALAPSGDAVPPRPQALDGHDLGLEPIAGRFEESLDRDEYPALAVQARLTSPQAPPPTSGAAV